MAPPLQPSFSHDCCPPSSNPHLSPTVQKALNCTHAPTQHISPTKLINFFLKKKKKKKKPFFADENKK